MQALSCSRRRVKIFGSMSKPFGSGTRAVWLREKILAPVCQITKYQKMVLVYDKDTPPNTISLWIRANAVEPVSCQHGPKVQTPLSCYCSWPHLLWKKSVCQTPVWIWRRSNRRSSWKYHLVLSDIPTGLRWDAKDYSQHHVRQRSSWWFRIHDKPNHSEFSGHWRLNAGA